LIEQGDGTMAILEELKRTGEARATPLAALALVATLGWTSPLPAEAAGAATGERSVSGVRISLGEEGRRWTLVPTLLDGKVESFVALREDVPYGENLTAVWYRKVALADGTASWETKAFDDQDQSKAVRAVKQALALADSTDESWPVAVAAVAAVEPAPMVKGVLESDALAPLVAELENPQPIVEMLEDAGWKAAWIGPLEGVAVATAGPGVVACPQDVVLGSMASGVEADPSGGADAEAVAFAKLHAVCGVCWPWTWTSAGPTCTGCVATGWTQDGDPVPDAPHCAMLCWFKGTLNCTWTRTRTRRLIDCTTCTWTQTGTTSETISSKSTTYFVVAGGCNWPPPMPFTCPTGPDNPSPACGSPLQTQSPGGWTDVPPGPPCSHW
jgi:hypothetical protein